MQLSTVDANSIAQTLELMCLLILLLLMQLINSIVDI